VHWHSTTQGIQVTGTALLKAFKSLAQHYSRHSSHWHSTTQGIQVTGTALITGIQVTGTALQDIQVTSTALITGIQVISTTAWHASSEQKYLK